MLAAFLLAADLRVAAFFLGPGFLPRVDLFVADFFVADFFVTDFFVTDFLLAADFRGAAFFLGPGFLPRLEPVPEVEPALRPRVDFFSGTLAPSSLASERPMAIACFLLVTFLPVPVRRVPCFRSSIAFFTFFWAFLEYLGMLLLFGLVIDYLFRATSPSETTIPPKWNSLFSRPLHSGNVQ